MEGQPPWLASLVSEVEARWNTSCEAMLLSQVGQFLAKHGFRLQDILQGKKLLQVLNQCSAGQLKIIQDPLKPLIWGLIPNSADDGSAVFPEPKARAAQSPARFRFDPSIWKAFVSAIPAGHRRFIFLTPPRFQDLPDEQTPPSGAIELLKPTIPEADDKTHWSTHVAAAISSWAAKHGVELKAIAARTVIENRNSANSTDSTETLLHELLTSLTPGERQRISLPLDIVAKLLIARRR